jgi:predicted RNase H-like nuclease (RuvC/YqgF family)
MRLFKKDNYLFIIYQMSIIEIQNDKIIKDKSEIYSTWYDIGQSRENNTTSIKNDISQLTREILNLRGELGVLIGESSSIKNELKELLTINKELKNEVIILRKLSGELKDEISEIRGLNEREKNLNVRSGVPFRFIPDYSSRLLPFKHGSRSLHG